MWQMLDVKLLNILRMWMDHVILGQLKSQS